MSRPNSADYAAYYDKYVSLVPEDDVLSAMRSETARTSAFLKGVSDEDATRRHPPYTWSIKEVVGHLIDAERVFGYRALRFARGDATPLAGFDENAYAQIAEFDRLPLSDLAAEFASLRQSHLWFFGNLPELAWERKGPANGNEISVQTLAFLLVGHERHHLAILRKRLGQA